MHVKCIYHKNITGYYIYMNRSIRIWNRFEESLILDLMCPGNILNKLLGFFFKKKNPGEFDWSKLSFILLLIDINFIDILRCRTTSYIHLTLSCWWFEKHYLYIDVFNSTPFSCWVLTEDLTLTSHVAADSTVLSTSIWTDMNFLKLLSCIICIVYIFSDDHFCKQELQLFQVQIV